MTCEDSKWSQSTIKINYQQFVSSSIWHINRIIPLCKKEIFFYNTVFCYFCFCFLLPWAVTPPSEVFFSSCNWLPLFPWCFAVVYYVVCILYIKTHLGFLNCLIFPECGKTSWGSMKLGHSLFACDEITKKTIAATRRHPNKRLFKVVPSVDWLQYDVCTKGGASAASVGLLHMHMHLLHMHVYVC